MSLDIQSYIIHFCLRLLTYHTRLVSTTLVLTTCGGCAHPCGRAVPLALTCTLRASRICIKQWEHLLIYTYEITKPLSTGGPYCLGSLYTYGEPLHGQGVGQACTQPICNSSHIGYILMQAGQCK